MWSTPVTLGGGITMVYGSRPSGLELNNLLSNQYWYHFPSTSAGLYLLANSILYFIYLIDYRIIECKINKSRWIIMYFCTTK